MSPNARKNLIYSFVLLGMVLIVYLYRSSTGGGSSVDEVARKNGLITWNGEFMDQPYLFLYHPERANVKVKLKYTKRVRILNTNAIIAAPTFSPKTSVSL